MPKAREDNSRHMVVTHGGYDFVLYHPLNGCEADMHHLGVFAIASHDERLNHFATAAQQV